MSRSKHRLWLVNGGLPLRILCLLAAMALPALGEYPQWWIDGGVVKDNAPITNDFAAVNQGQLKWLSIKAAEHMETNLVAVGGAGSSISNLISTFSTTNNYLPVNQGQLKSIASTFYDRLIETTYTNAYPWTNSPNANDYALVNIGQVKHLFNFDLTSWDTDADGMSDDWEIQYGLDPNDPSDAHADPDRDGLTNVEEYQSGKDPLVREDTQVTRYVVGLNPNAVPPYTSWATAASNIQDAVDAADPWDTIVVTNGTYLLSSSVLIEIPITLRGLNGWGNTVLDGGGSSRCLSVLHSGALIEGCTLTGGSGVAGGGVYLGAGWVRSCMISNNIALVAGGGAWCAGGGLVSETWVVNNTTVGWGGGVFGPDTKLVNCVIAENSAVVGGGCLGTSNLNCTIVRNTAQIGGGVVEGSCENSIVFHNVADTLDNYYNSDLSYSCSLPIASGDGNIALDPQLQEYGDYAFQLRFGSPCLDAASESAPVYDLVGNTRTRDGDMDGSASSDIGAYELTFHFVVQGNLDAAAPYESWETGASTIQDAIDVADAGDTVIVSNGVYATGGGDSRVVVSNGVSVVSLNGPGVTVIEGNGPEGAPMRGVYVGAGAFLSGFTIRNCHAGEWVSGGGVLCESEGIVDCCVISDNSAGLDGGGVYGGIVRGCLIKGNAADWCGGGVYSSTRLELSTVIGNVATGSGGGVYISDTVLNCIVYDNMAADNANVGSVDISYSCTFPTMQGVGNITNAPMLVSPEDPHLLAGSPCIDAGMLDSSPSLVTDIDGEPRVQNGSVDMGCDEFLFALGSGEISVDIVADCTNLVSACLPVTLAFTPLITGGATYYEWQSPNGGISTNSGVFEFSFATSGVYRIVLSAFSPYETISTTTTVSILEGGATHYVSDGGTGQVPYLSWATAAPTIQDAIDCAQVGDTVRVASGIYSTGGSFVPGVGENRISLTLPITVISQDGAGSTVLEGVPSLGTNGVRCAYVTNGAALVGFSLRNGATETNGTMNNASGGGALVDPFGLLVDCYVNDNASQMFGGGIMGGRVRGCTVVSNSATTGGGVYDASCLNSIVVFNEASSTGANHAASQFGFSCTVPLVSGDGNIATDPSFMDNHLWRGSPCVDVGTNAYSVLDRVDMDGGSRISGAVIDMGCDEFAANRVGNIFVTIDPLSIVTQGVTTIDFVAEVSGAVEGYAWTWGENNMVSDELLLSLQLTLPGEYEVVLTASNSTHQVAVTSLVTILAVANTYVSPSGSHTAPYTNWVMAANDIQSAIDVTTDGGIVHVTNGIYSTGSRTIFGSSSNRVVIPRPLVVQSVNGSGVTTIEGAGTPESGGVRCVYLGSGAQLRGFTLSNGSTGDEGSESSRVMDGGGAWCETDATLEECVITECTASMEGGGVFGGVIRYCTIATNCAEDGGGACRAVLENCLVVSNSATIYGGGTAYCSVKGCTVVNNTAGQAGGCFGGAISNSIIYYNEAYSDDNYDSSTPEISHSCTYPLPADGIGNITNAPSFIDYENGDFRLATNSACLDAGAANGLIDDIVHMLRPLDGDGDGVSELDMGAYEYDPFAGSYSANYHFVSPNGRDIPPYTNWSMAARAIQDALDVSQDGHTVVVAAGRYDTGGSVAHGTLTNRVVLTNAVEVRSSDGPEKTFIVGMGSLGDSAVRCAYVTNGASLVGFTLTNGHTLAEGSIEDCSGGGIWAEEQGIISNCFVLGNAAALYGGGVFGGRVTGSWIDQNCASNGGGANVSELVNCTVINNVASGDAGGLYGGIALNTILYANLAATINSNYNGTLLTNCFAEPVPAAGANIGGDPLLIEGWRLLSTSPCLNAGDDSFADLDGLDVDGDPRKYGAHVDIGCDEFVPENLHGPVALTVDLQASSVQSSEDICTTATVDGAISDFLWDWGDGSQTSNQLVASHTYMAIGDYDIVLTAQNADGITSVTTTVHILPWTRYVSLSNAAPVSPYTSWETAATNIQDAIDASLDGDTVWVTNGVYDSGVEVGAGQSNRIAVIKAITVNSVHGAEFTHIVGSGPIGDSAVRCAYLNDGAVLRGFTLRDGATVDLESGGGAYCEDTARLEDCRIVGCAASEAGGGLHGGSATRCWFIDNQGGDGGGAASAVLRSCFVCGNVADTASGSSTSGSGGGLWDGAAVNCTIVNNSASSQGGGVSGGDSVYVSNSIVFYNDAPQYPNMPLSVDVGYSCSSPLFAGDGNVAAVPMLLSLGGPYLSSSSSCIDAGLDSLVSAGDLDIEGDSRSAGAHVDMGADEVTGGSHADVLSVELMASTTNVGVMQPVEFKGYVSGRSDSVTWALGDGSISSNRAVILHFYQTPGEYDVTLTASNASGASSATVTVTVAEANMHYVSYEGSHTWPYTNWVTAATNIQSAISASIDGDTVLVTNGIYATGGAYVPVGSMSNRVAITNAITLSSVNGASVTTILGKGPDGPGAMRCVYVGKNAVVSGFTLSGGGTTSTNTMIPEYCGVAYCEPSARIERCHVTSNAVAGVHMYGGHITSCLIYSNVYDTSVSSSYFTAVDVDNATIVDDKITFDRCDLRNSVISAQTLYMLSGSSARYCCGTNGPGCIIAEPVFVDAAGGDYRLAVNSPCIDAGNGGDVADVDLDGNDRIQDGDGDTVAVIDMGAYEAETIAPVGYHYVSVSNAAPVSPYTNWVTAATNIQDAIDIAEEGDTVLVSNGVYNIGGVAINGLTNRIVVTNAITVRSVNGPESTLIVGAGPLGEGAVRCAYLDGGAVLDGFTLTNGHTAVADPIERGGGVYTPSEGTSEVIRCVLVGNVAAGNGGGAWGVALSWCTVSGNTALWGGGVAVSDLNNCQVSENSSIEGGGAFYSVLNECRILSNSTVAGAGGARECTLVNCLIAGNAASWNGAACFCSLTHCTVVDNSATNFVSLYDTSVHRSIVYGNSTADDPLSSAEENVFTESYSDETGNGTTLSNVPPPGFVCSAAGDYRLASWSPCIDVLEQGQTAADLDGTQRPQDGNGDGVNKADMGAYEYSQLPYNPYEGQGFRYVDLTNETASAPYTNWTTAATCIQDAIDAADYGDTILVAPGVYSQGGRDDYGGITSRVSLARGVRLVSLAGADKTIIEGSANENGSPVRCAFIESGCELIGFTLSNGWTRLDTIDLRSNAGGGALAEGSGKVSWCHIKDCTARLGGGMSGGQTENSHFEANVAELGGGLYDSTAVGALIVSNRAINGGGAWTANLLNCTLTENKADSGGGVWGGTVSNCVVYGNAAPAGSNWLHLANADCSCIAPDPGGDNNITNAPPGFEPSLDGHYRLSADSPCIDAAGTVSEGSGMDIDGEPRLWGAAVDIGCDEYCDQDGTGAPDWWEQERGQASDPLHEPIVFWVSSASSNQAQIAFRDLWEFYAPTEIAYSYVLNGVPGTTMNDPQSELSLTAQPASTNTLEVIRLVNDEPAVTNRINWVQPDGISSMVAIPFMPMSYASAEGTVLASHANNVESFIHSWDGLFLSANAGTPSAITAPFGLQLYMTCYEGVESSVILADQLETAPVDITSYVSNGCSSVSLEWRATGESGFRGPCDPVYMIHWAPRLVPDSIQEE